MVGGHKNTKMMTSSSSSPSFPVNFHAYYGEFSSSSGL